MKKTGTALLLAAGWAGLCLAAPLEVSANSAQSDWEGTRANGAVVKAGECPLIVEQELLTFDIPEFPETHYQSREEFLAYNGNVSAEYTFYNPEDYSVTATLVFPFGKVPEYGFQYDTATLQPVYGADTEKYGVTVNGEEVEKRLRHTYAADDFYDRARYGETAGRVCGGSVLYT